jgi:uncharacterized RDD family membrane protein YckC
MPFRIIGDETRGILYYRLRYLSLAAAVFIVAPAVLLIAFGIFFLITFLDPEASPSATEMGVAERLFAVAVMLAVSLPFLWLARRFVLGKRRLVLFLRRFRRRSALATVSHAAMTSSGFGLRIVTLDDGASARLAGEAASHVVTTNSEIDLALRSVRRMTGRLWGPKRLFLQAADTVWQDLVYRLAEESTAVLIDVSEPSPSLLWEVETIGSRAWPRWILVGELDMLRSLAGIDVSSEPHATPHERLARLLQGQEILAYEVGRNERAFQRSLQARYELVTRLSFTGEHWMAAASVAPNLAGASPPPAPPLLSGGFWAPTPVGANLANMSPPPPPPLPSGGPQARWRLDRDFGLPERGAGSLASVADRARARLVDLGVVLVLAIVVAGIEAAVRAAAGINATEDGDALSTAVGVVLLGLIVAYDPLTTRLFGATPGKWALDLQVVTQSSLEPAKSVLLGLRSLTMLVLWSCCLLPGILDIAAAAHDPYRRAWHDKVTETLVVRGQRRHGRRAAATRTAQPWRSLAARAAATRDRFDRFASTVEPGPIAHGLADIRRLIGDCVADCESLTARAEELASVADAVDTTGIRVRAAAARADALAHPEDRDLQSLAAALAAELASSERLHALLASLDRNLHRLVAQLNDVVNQAIAVAFGSTRDADLRSLVDQLEALREAFADTAAQVD